ncbi:MAG: DUF2844 domain-containing protein [Betaproteobacteria bacterium]|nr:DUF2844 domain-containing protein [Betaproteobacteria bacterium]MDE2424216.1 DUF2844 domain-containing protein [Betaproteobacteria bacterium]
MINLKKLKFIFMTLGFFSAFSAHSTLGGAPLAQMMPYTQLNEIQLQTSSGVTYQVVIQQNTRGMVFKEFVYQGQVFAQVWFGSAVPSLNEVLGANLYSRYENALIHSTNRSHRQVQITDQELNVTNYGRMGDFWGTSYLSNSLPPGFSINDIQ